MGVCCLLGASLAGASPAVAKTMERFGVLLGLGYQLFDDAADHDLPVTGFDATAEARVCLNEAQELLRGLPTSGAREQLFALCTYLIHANSPNHYQPI
jgi:geranylgeranyl pyrophosphate synthase